MPKYKVTVEEVCVHEFIVEAESEDHIYSADSDHYADICATEKHFVECTSRLVDEVEEVESDCPADLMLAAAEDRA